jgi:hypothetical protein
MNIIPFEPFVNPALSHTGEAPALGTYLGALEAYQQRRTVEGKAVLLRSYRQWIRAFLDDDAEADRAANNFLIALRNQPPESRDAA